MAPKPKKTGLITADGKEIIRVVGGTAAAVDNEQSIQGYLEPIKCVADLPVPITWQILVQPLNIPTKVGSILIPDDAVRKAEYLRNVAKVWRVGPLAFRDATKYGPAVLEPDYQPPVKAGDWVIMDQYAGSETIIHRQKFRLVIEDEIRAIAPNPEAFRFYY